MKRLKTPYKDTKKWFWLLSIIYPAISLPAIYFHYKTSNALWLFYPFFITYFLTPILDTLIGEDSNNPPLEIIPKLEKEKYYRLLTFLTIPIHYIVFLVSASYAAMQPLNWWEFLLVASSAGLASGLAINTGHELGHKKTKLERNLAKIVLAVPAYGHFSIEHNRGHHSQVSTPQDAASARMGENIYAFACREIPDSFKNAIKIESKRLKRLNKSFWTRDNQILQSMSLTLLLQGGLIVLFGSLMISFLMIHNLFAWWQLTSANYVEHYGLLRKELSNGKYEHCKPHHSWNSNFLLSNLHLFHLQRHSDHHTHPTRRYQSLRSYDDLPSLPNGYLGCYILAYIPWAWFYVMDKRLLNLKHINGDFSKINIHPKKRDSLTAKYS